jgi:chorismate mutase
VTPDDPGSMSRTAMTVTEALLEAFAERMAAGDEVGAEKAWQLYEAATRAAIQRQLDRNRKLAAARVQLPEDLAPRR